MTKVFVDIHELGPVWSVLIGFNNGTVKCSFEDPSVHLRQLAELLGLEVVHDRVDFMYVTGPNFEKLSDGPAVAGKFRVTGFRLVPDTADRSSCIEFRDHNPEQGIMESDTVCMVTLSGTCDTPERVRMLTEELGFTLLPEGQ